MNFPIPSFIPVPGAETMRIISEAVPIDKKVV